MDKKVNYKRSKIYYKAGQRAVSIKITALDSVALLSSLNSTIKQLRVITSVDSTIKGIAAGQSEA